MSTLKSFASDNNSGVHARVMRMMAAVNAGSARAYGDDAYTARAVEALREAFGPAARPWFVFLGTAANVLGIKSMTRPHHGVFCAESAHIYTDECGAPEALTGCKLLPLPVKDGKIALQDCRRALAQRDSVHQSWPSMLSVSQTTECGTVYTLEELRRIGEYCRANKLHFHLDGARLSNAAARLGVSLKELTADVGVDALSFGGTKNGLMFGEAVIFFNDALGHDFGHVRKQNMQLGSKMRFIAAQFLEYMKDDLWLENARNANAMTDLLAGELRGMEHVRIVHPVEGNAIFARLPRTAIDELRATYYFYIIDDEDAEGFPAGWPMVRLMTSFNTTEEDVRGFAAAVRAAAG